MKQCVHQNYYLEYPKPSSFKPSFQTSPSTNINKSSNEFSLDNFNFEQLLIKGDVLVNFNQRIFIPTVKRFSLQPKPLQILPTSKKMDQRHRKSWCLIRNLVKGLHCMTTPEIRSIKDEVIYYYIKEKIFNALN